MTSVFLLALLVSDNSIVDIFWGLGFILLAALSLFLSEDVGLKKVLVNLLILIWGLRLSIYIFLRNKGKGEDFRYANWRRTWKFFILRSYFQVFMLQGFFMLIISWPVLHINNNISAGFGMLDALGVALFITGFLFEVIGDYQLYSFKKDPENKNKLITNGLWKITRHPNYFGEALLWWGIWLMAVPVVDGILTMLSPIVITWLVRYVSGVPMLEKKYKGRPDWEEYASKTPVFVPFVKKWIV
jgi:steroid 5-alpha reductase family enzyme